MFSILVDLSLKTTKRLNGKRGIKRQCRPSSKNSFAEQTDEAQINVMGPQHYEVPECTTKQRNKQPGQQLNRNTNSTSHEPKQQKGKQDSLKPEQPVVLIGDSIIKILFQKICLESQYVKSLTPRKRARKLINVQVLFTMCLTNRIS